MHEKWLVRGRAVAVREMIAEDAELIVEWRNRPDVTQWLLQWRPLTVESHLEFFNEARRRDAFLIFATPSGAPVATAAFYNFDRNRTSCEWGRLCRTDGPFAARTILEGAYLAHRFAFELLNVVRTFRCLFGREQPGCAIKPNSRVRSRRSSAPPPARARWLSRCS